MAFGQQATRLELRLTTRSAWNARQLSLDGPQAICLAIAYAPGAPPSTRICVTPADVGPRPQLTQVDLDVDGQPTGDPRPLFADTAQIDGKTLLASISPLDAGLPRGKVYWHAESRYEGPDGATCETPGGCVDRLPNEGDVPARAELLDVPSCFGAAARDPGHPCANPALARTMVPTPQDALITPNAICRPEGLTGRVAPCSFGVAPDPAKPTVALLGDSHAVHWRGALEVAAQALGWQGISVTRSSCPFTLAGVVLSPPSKARKCREWEPQARAYLRQHTEIRSIFVSAHAAVRYTSDPVSGFRRLWASMPSHIKHIYVLRDTPTIPQPQSGCVAGLVGTSTPVGYRCAQPRAKDLRPDPAAVAARGSGDNRVELIDLTRYMCTPNVCPPVIGGVLVHKDGDHLTRLFSTTLGPFLLRELRRSGAS